MTREEAIVDIRDNIKPVVGGISLDMAIEALEQQPCKDCISRQAVKDNELIDKLPSVTPKEKTGHWINKTLIYKSEAGNEYDCYTGTCSVCGETQECWNYCGGCGARMVSE